MNNKNQKSDKNNKEVSASKITHNLIMVAAALGTFALFGYAGILIFIFVRFYVFKD